MSTLITPQKSKSVVRQTKLLINNEWVDAAEGGRLPAINPATGEVITEVAAGSATDVDRAVKAARSALESGPWGSMDAVERGRLMFKLADLVDANAKELASLESLNSGKTINDSLGDMSGVAATLRYYAGWADKIEGRTVPVRGNFLSYPLPSTCRSGGSDHSLEFPPLDARVEVGARSDLWQYDRDEAGRTDPTHRFENRRTRHRSWLPARRDQFD